MADLQPQGYLAVPASGTGPGVLVLHAWWGLNPFLQGVCQRLARAGFTAFAPDLYHGQIAVSIAEAERLSSQLNPEQAQADIQAAVTYLQGLRAVSRPTLSVIGFSLGAFFAVDASCRMPAAIDAVVTFYGTGYGDFSASRAAYLGHFAESDAWEPPSNVQQFEKSLRAAQRPAAFYTYPETGHWFFEQDRGDAYQPQAARLAWRRTLKFLRSPH